MNPIVALRSRLGLSRIQMAKKIGTTYGFLTQVELGYPMRLPQSIVEGLTRIGEDAEQIQREYRKWRQGEAVS